MRLDEYLVREGKFPSRTRAARAITEGRVLISGQRKKPSYEIKPDDAVTLCLDEKFVSLGGYKLDKAIEEFEVNVDGLVFADIGASTGGFTDCLLQRGAGKVFAVDVGEGLLDDKIRSDPRVVPIENFNAKNIDEKTFGGKVDAAVIDCSFISLKSVLPPVMKAVDENGFIIALVKPQFESGKGGLGKGGIVKNPKTRINAVADICDFAEVNGLKTVCLTAAPIRSGKNIEYLILLSRNGSGLGNEKIRKILEKQSS